MKVVLEFYFIFMGDKYNVFFFFILVCISLVVIDMWVFFYILYMKLNNLFEFCVNMK